MGIVRKYCAIVKEIQNPLKDIFTVLFSPDRKFQFCRDSFYILRWIIMIQHAVARVSVLLNAERV